MKRGIYRMMSGLSELTELPLTEMCREFSATLSGRREITVDGVLSIKKYENDHIALEVCGDKIHIFGKNLTLKNYYHATLCISGNIDQVAFGGNNGNVT
ncbi:MAG: YabP/YqfC family sporulation protein [Clostridia bacterium]|nr:YabP/YqfC family sporulation protein [Clostridia bacterium]